MTKFIVGIFFIFGFWAIGYAVDFDQGDTWVSNRYQGAITEYRYRDRIQLMNIGGRIYEFKKSGRNLYRAYDDETGNFLEMRIKSKGDYGEWEIFDYETGESWLIKEPAKRE